MHPGMEHHFSGASGVLRRVAGFLGVLAILSLFCVLAYVLRAVLTPVLAALATAYILNPVVTWAHRRTRLPRLATVLVVFVGVGALLVGGSVLLLTQLAAEVQQFADRVPGYVEAVRSWLRSSPQANAATQALAGVGRPGWDAALAFVKEHGAGVARTAASGLTTVLASVYTVVSLLVLVPLFLFFFLWRFDDLVRTIRDHLPAAQRDLIVSVVQTIDRAVANFFRGRLLVCLAVALVTAVGWSLVGVPYALPLGLLAGVLNLVPFLSLLAVPPALFCAFLGASEAGRPWAVPVVLTMAVYLGVQALESFVLSPAIESRTSGLHPLVVVLALLIGGQVAGMLGVLLAVPVASTLKALAAQFIVPALRRAAGVASDNSCSPQAGGPDASAG